MQTDVQKAYAGALGQMGANGGGSVGGMLNEIAGLGVTLSAMGGVIGMTKDAMASMMSMGIPAATAAATAVSGWDCICGTKNIQSKFCPECGGRKPESKSTDAWDCSCGNKGITGKFCTECGSKRPEAPSTWDCVCGNKGITGKFCGECGAKRPEAPTTWDCPCGNKGITGKFCTECGKKRGD